MLRTIRNSVRLVKISLLLARHDALFPLEEMNAPAPLLLLCKLLARKNEGLRRGQRLAAALEELGPTFIKLGQALSTRSDLIGDDIAQDLSDLRDNLPPFPTEEAYRIIEDEFQTPADRVFSHFNETPVAAASIAQVHFATLHDGQEVAVKILRPGIEEAFRKDIELFFWLAEMVERSWPSYRRLKPRQVVQLFEESIRFELDLRFEASAAVELKENLKHDEGFIVPEIFWGHTSRRVMCMTRIRGIPAGDIAALVAAGHDLDAILEKAARNFFNQVFRDGFFHADLHPGNLFILDNGDIAAVDFGIMGRISKKDQLFLGEILRGFINEDYRHVAEMHFAAGYVPAHKSVDNFTLACMGIAKPILGKPLSEISLARLLGQLFKVAETFEMETQLQLLMLQKTMMLAEGMGRMLNPNINMWQLAQPMIEGWAMERMGPQARLKSAVEDTMAFSHKLPMLFFQLEQALGQVASGGIKLHPASVEAMHHSRSKLHRQWLALAWTSLVVLSCLLIF